MNYGISRNEEFELPSFKNHNEARRYFRDKYGDNFLLTGIQNQLDGKIYFYKLILNENVFREMNEELNNNGFCAMTDERMFCTQDIQIFSDGSIHIVH